MGRLLLPWHWREYKCADNGNDIVDMAIAMVLVSLLWEWYYNWEGRVCGYQDTDIVLVLLSSQFNYYTIGE